MAQKCSPPLFLSEHVLALSPDRCFPSSHAVAVCDLAQHTGSGSVCPDDREFRHDREHFPVQVRSRQQMRCTSCKSAVSDDIKNKIARVTGGDPAHITPQDLYQGAAHSVRDELFDEFNATNKYFECVYHVSGRPSSCDTALTTAGAAGKGVVKPGVCM